MDTTETKAISVRIPVDRIEKLNKIANQYSSRNESLNHAIDNFIEMHESWEAGIARALQEVKDGKSRPAEEVFAEIEAELGY